MPDVVDGLMDALGEERLLSNYSPLPRTYDEVFDGNGTARLDAAHVVAELDQLGRSEFLTRQKLAEGALFRSGVTFSVYSDSRGQEKIFPFDLIPRIIEAGAWEKIDQGIKQRVAALNAFLNDIYGEQRILEEGRVPKELLLSSKGYLPEVRGIRPPGSVFVHIAGVDLIRGRNGEFLVLEDNLQVPSGVSYVLENRGVMKRVFPGVFRRSRVRSVDGYAARLKDAFQAITPRPGHEPRIVLLTPGPYNSAYFEHGFLARQMGCDLVEGGDLLVEDERVFVKTTRGPKRVDVIYRRLNDDFLDPEFFRPDSALGVPGLMAAYAAGNVALVNAPGNGVADNKAIYPWVPDMIRFYLDEEPILEQVETHLCAVQSQCQHVLERLDSMVVKAVDGHGGYGMLFGPKASKAEIAEFAERIRAKPEGYIAQPVIELSTCPTWANGEVSPRRVDLRPFAITGSGTWVLPGGLTRVALREGSYVVNSSQGGGSKDTWVLEEATP